MPSEPTLLSVAASLVICLLVIGLPGLVTGLAAGLRGWTLAGLTPLLSYAIGGLAGPWTAALGLPFTTWTFAVTAVLFAAVAFGLRRLTVRKWPPPPVQRVWEPRAHWAVGACVLLAAAVGFYAAVRGMGHFGAIAQGGDAPYTANGVRYIASTGDGGLFGMGTLNWYGDASPPFYPNAYHLLAAEQYTLSGSGSIPLTLDTNTVLLPGLLALSLVVTVREFGGRAVLAGAVALASVAPVMSLYESMNRGPLYPFMLGMALTPLAAVVLRRYLNRVAPDTGFALVMSAVGLLCIHSSTLFGAILFAGPLLIQRWIERWRTIGRDLLALLPIAVVALLVAWLQLFGALGLANGSLPYLGWPVEWRATNALGALLGFQHWEPHPQLWLSVALLLGFIFFNRLGSLRWIGLTALLTGLFYIAVSSSNAPLVMALSRPWWDDPYRFMSMAVVPLSFIAGHGVASLHAWLRVRLPARLPAAALAAVVLLGFVAITNGLYAPSNGDRVASGYRSANPREQNITPDEERAMVELGKLAHPGEWAMNDRNDGTPWTYALSGVRTVAAHDDGTTPPADAWLLAARFRDYETDPEVRAAVARLNIHWVILGRPAAPPNPPYSFAGLNRLDGLPFLHQVYRNEDAVIYRLNR
ncbi:hypothetical protein ATK36_3137 [Amycolatopsis sulphurea]|uniref:4-amino-4-deoxy-L-arabinose transferase-like glycosyltransferase n=1 Tax=Amycolatopsis sulphurea TaxID=76022 RepID=A0A2A9FAT6_9PSEU|nr:DUF6541 family protein [Amycolatopsis sulphurea]PFG48063.1 hypothetical protein ATK36_3137 [Amycolatopsis sulphurea]